MFKYFKKLKNNKGTETIEFVILFPLMAFLIFGSISYMFAIYSKIVVVDAAREGARAVALNSTTAKAKVDEVIAGMGLKIELIDSVTVTENEENGIGYVYVQVVYKQPSMFPMLPLLIGNPEWDDYFTLSSQAIFKKEKI